MRKIAFLFPGQGSQAIGMGRSFYEADPKVRERFSQANKTIQFDLENLIFAGSEEELRKTSNTQPALLTVSIAALTRFQAEGIVPDFLAGHSLGEYSALVAAGALSFSEALIAVRQRGLLMEEALPNSEGAMSAVLGLTRDDLGTIVKQVSAKGNLVELANLNCPGQIVISGSKQGVAEASELAKNKGARRVIPLQVSGPFHSSIMKTAAEKFAKVLAEEVSIKDPELKVISNVTAQPLSSADEIEKLLIKQIYSPVLWEDSIRYLLDQGVRTFIELGNGKVLSGLVKKIDRQAKVFPVYDEESYMKAIKALQEV